MDRGDHVIDMTTSPGWRLLDDAINFLIGPGTSKASIGDIARGFGVSIVPASSRLLRSLDVVYHPFQGATPTFDLALAWLPDNTSPLLHNFLQVARETAHGL